MTDSSWALLFSILAAAGTLASVIGQLVKVRKDAAGAERDDARDDAKAYSEISLRLIDPLKQANIDLQKQIDKMRGELESLQQQVAALQMVNSSLRSQASISDMRARHYREYAYRGYHQLRSHGIEPLFDPTKDFGDPPTQPNQTTNGGGE